MHELRINQWMFLECVWFRWQRVVSARIR
jgi:hypothetical protein